MSGVRMDYDRVLPRSIVEMPASGIRKFFDIFKDENYPLIEIIDENNFEFKGNINYFRPDSTAVFIDYECDKSEKYKREISEAILLRDFIENDIGNITDKIESEVLAQKYLCGKTLEEIGYIINYSKRHTERLHLKALSIIEL